MKKRGEFCYIRRFLIFSLIIIFLIPKVNSDALSNFTKEPLTSEKFNYLKLVESESRTHCPEGNCYIVWEVCNLNRLEQNKKELSYFITDIGQKQDESKKINEIKYQIFDREIINNAPYEYDCVEVNNQTGEQNCKTGYNQKKEIIYKDSNINEILDSAQDKCVKIKQIVKIPEKKSIFELATTLDIIPKLYNFIYPEWLTITNEDITTIWQFNDKVDPTEDTKGINDLDLVNMEVPGDFEALYFLGAGTITTDGINEYGKNLAFSSWNENTQDLSISFWIKSPSASGRLMTYVDDWDLPKGIVDIGMRTSGKFFVDTWCSGTRLHPTMDEIYTINDGNWHFITYTFQSGIDNVTVYVDGNKIKTDSSGACNSDTESTNFGVSGLYTGSLLSSASFDEIAIMKNYLLSPSDIVELYSSGNGLEYPYVSNTLPAILDISPENNTRFSNQTFIAGYRLLDNESLYLNITLYFDINRTGWHINATKNNVENNTNSSIQVIDNIQRDVNIEWLLEASDGVNRINTSIFNFSAYNPNIGATVCEFMINSSDYSNTTNADFDVYIRCRDNESDSLISYINIQNETMDYIFSELSNITNDTLTWLFRLDNNVTSKNENWTFKSLCSDKDLNTSWSNQTINIDDFALSLTSISSTVSNNLTADYMTEKFNVTLFDYDFNDGYPINCKFYINDTENNTLISNSTSGNNGYCGFAIQNLTKGNYNISLQVVEGEETVKMDWLLNVITVYGAILNSSSGLNSTSENLTCITFNIPEGVTELFSWYKDGNSLNNLYLPFEINADDYSSNNNNGAVSGASLVTDNYGNVYSFDGDDYINISDSNTLDDIKTFELWFKRDSTNPEVLFDKSNIENQTNYKLVFDSNDKLVFSYNLMDGAGNYTWLTSTQSDFDQGSYSNTNYSTNHIELSAGQSTGLYTSKIFDANSSSVWNTITFGTDLPYQQELPNNKGSDSGADMSSNVLLMHMNENSGSIIDSSGENNNGNYNGSLYTQEGKFNTALGFDGSSDYLQIPSSSGDELDIKSDITVSAWIKWKGPSDPPDIYYPRIIEKSYTTSYMLSLKQDDATRLSVWLNNGERASTSAGSLSLNQWHYVAFTFNDITNNVIIYIDGEQSSTGSYTGIISGSNNDVYIGRYPLDTVAYWNGSIDEVAVYNRTLSADEILNNYKRGALRLNLTARTCDDASCTGESFTDVNDISPQNLSLNNNRYFQYKFNFETENISYSPELYNVSIDYSVYGTDITEINITSNTSIADNAWHHTAITFDENTLKLYLDSILDNSKIETNLPEHKNNNLFIGRDYSGTNYFTGDLDEIRFYDDVLSPEQINANYNLEYNQIVSQELNTNDLWRCDVTPNDGSKDFDRISSNNLTVLGATYMIMFSIIDSFTGEQLTIPPNMNVNCTNGLNDTITSNPSNNYVFYEGGYSCTFKGAMEQQEYFDKTISFTADSDKIVNVPMSKSGWLTEEEHVWLETLYDKRDKIDAIYDCLYGNVSCNIN